MSDDMLVVQYPVLEHAGVSLQKALDTLHARLEEVSQLGKGLTASWEGDAKEAYLIRQAGWERAGSDLTQMLRDIKVQVDAALQRYRETEGRNAALFPGHS
jgi:early secretory antigenic target protein ESAT-6